MVNAVKVEMSTWPHLYTSLGNFSVDVDIYIDRDVCEYCHLNLAYVIYIVNVYQVKSLL